MAAMENTRAPPAILTNTKHYHKKMVASSVARLHLIHAYDPDDYFCKSNFQLTTGSSATRLCKFFIKISTTRLLVAKNFQKRCLPKKSGIVTECRI
ncbi:hypothetical protein RIR_jg40019.t1 [Rhizophagus irregularis DAOM 181602=DAOM 197198]|nr:hypothetical protein RIR_jg40019.t1 [Rhizophagus irregularis DAOM 181602=DAOM 197198]